jgi:anti-sigma regulatory factor (Ser/Thr protein kinase)
VIEGVSAARIEVSLDRRPLSARRARDAVAQLLGVRAPVGFVRDALLLTSELVSNAITHGEGACELRASFTSPPDHLRVDVIDESPFIPILARGAVRRARVGGLGLVLVAEVASDWGVGPSAGGGKSVWFEIGS